MTHDSITRRAVIGGLAAAAAASGAKAGAPQRILILGGTNFLGPATVETALARGHRVTLFNRGRTRPGLFPNVEKLQGDRDPKKGEGLKALGRGEWDVVLDNSGFYPRMVAASAGLLAGRVKRYIYISSASVYASDRVEGEDETAPLATMPDPALEEMGPDFRWYGALKALCEQAAEKAMPGRVAVIRPGYIVGPDDPSGRFTYWPVRAGRGGEILAPGTPGDPVQFIDVRDLGAWIVRLCESGTTGVFNAMGPAKRLTMGPFLEACRRAATSRSSLTWVSAAFVERQKLPLPIWAPYEGETRGAHTRKMERALRAGLAMRPYGQTVKDTLAWHRQQPKDGRVRLAGPSAEQEAAALAAWRAGKA